MGGEGPYVRFDENAQFHRGWTSRILSGSMDDDQLDKAYTRAHPFLLERVRQLVKLGWEQHETNGSSITLSAVTDGAPSTDALLAHLSHTRVLTTYWGDRQDHVELRLPRTASAWFEASLVSQWKEMFERSFLFETRRRRWSGSPPDRYADAYLYVDVEAPLRDIFNFLQCLIPDMLVIIRVDDIDDVGEEEITQRLPSSRWVDDYAAELRPIFGEDGFKNVVQGSKESACHSQMLSRYLDDYQVDDRLGDFTACDKECGYCGQCDY